MRLFLITIAALTLFSCAGAEKRSGAETDTIKSESKAFDLTIPRKTPDGSYIFYRPDGSKRAAGEVISGKKTSLWTIYFSGPKPGIIHATGNYQNDIPDGEWTIYYENGNIMQRSRYRNGQLHGSQVSFYEKRTPKLDITYKDGVKHGKFQRYAEDGKPIEILWYDNGKRDGQTNLFYPNGKRQAIGVYKNDQKNGRWTYYHEDGTRKSSGLYTDDKKTGRWIFYDEKGRVTEEKEFKL